MSGGGGGAAGTLAVTNEYLYKIHGDLLSSGVTNWETDESPIDSVDKSYISMMNEVITQVSNLIYNPTFEDYKGWTGWGSWTLSGTDAVHSPGSTTTLSQPEPFLRLLEGTEYTFIVTVSERTAGSVTFSLNGTDTNTIDTNGTFLLGAVAGSSGGLVITPTSDFDGKISDPAIYHYRGNPYLTISAYDPDTEVEAISSNVDDFKIFVDDFISEDLWDDAAGIVGDRALTEFSDIDVSVDVSNIIESSLISSAKQILQSISSSIANKNMVMNDIDSAVDTVVDDVMDAAKNKVESSVQSLFSSGKIQANAATFEVINSAIAAAQSAINSAAITSAVNAYENRRLNTLMRSVNRIAGPMSDINAVNSSAFTIGIALLEMEFINDVNKVDADLSLQMYKDAFDKYVTMFSETLTQYLRSQLELFARFVVSHLEYVKTHIQVVTAILDGQINTFNTIFSNHLTAQSSADIQTLRSRTSLIAAGTDQLTRMILTKKALEASYYDKVDMYHKFKAAMEKEEHDRNIEINYLEATWDLSIFQTAGSLLSAVAGGSTYIPNKPNQVGNVAGGALSGAAAGAMVGSAIPGIGTAIGAGVGAILGGISGANQ